MGLLECSFGDQFDATVREVPDKTDDSRSASDSCGRKTKTDSLDVAGIKEMNSLHGNVF